VAHRSGPSLRDEDQTAKRLDEVTLSQASRLWNLDAVVCQALLSALVHEVFLSETPSGAYLRRGSGRRRVQTDQPERTPDGGRDDVHVQLIQGK
jgi:hypothetical protein